LPNKVDQIETLSKEGSSSSKDTFVYGYLWLYSMPNNVMAYT
jgi:hypothetical protein